jgi:hypothetical protein
MNANANADARGDSTSDLNDACLGRMERNALVRIRVAHDHAWGDTDVHSHHRPPLQRLVDERGIVRRVGSVHTTRCPFAEICFGSEKVSSSRRM